MPRLRPVVLACLLAAVPVLSGAGGAATPPSGEVSPKTPTRTWRGTVAGPAPAGCGQPAAICDALDVVVNAPAGRWVTISVDAESANVRVTTAGRLVGSGGQSLDVNPRNTTTPTTTFQQTADGRVTYHVQVGDALASPATPFSYTGTVRLAGHEFDRAGDCGLTPGVEHAAASDGHPTRAVRVRLVADPKDAAAVRQAGRTIVETYARIAVPIRVSYDFRHIPRYQNYPYEGVRAAYGGVRPRGVDVVHVMTDEFAGGIADCIGGIAYPEKAFSVGNVHYTVQGTVPVSQVPGGMVAAHEIGHLLGAQHQQFNCAEALPQEQARPARDGWTGPCTLMSPTAVNASETFSTLERDSIRYYADTYGGQR